MERGFQSLLLTGKYEDSDDNFPPFKTSDDPHITTNTITHTQHHNNYTYNSSYNILNDNIIHISNEYNQNTLKKLKTKPATASFCFPPTNMFSQLPELHSIEHNFSPVSFTADNHHTLDSLTTSFSYSPTNMFRQLPELRSKKQNYSPAKLSNREKMYRLRQKISNKTQSLQKLLPVEKKMDIATIYEEAYKYIMFLKAQITALECMPVTSSCSGSRFRSGNPRYEGLEKLNRQQLLEVVVNSPVAQSVMYNKGCCVYSLEQLMLFNNVVQKRFFCSDQ